MGGDFVRKAWQLAVYGMSTGDWTKLLSLQEGRCGICHRPFKTGRVPHIDHDHRSGFLRGLLDVRCNSDLLGHFGDDPDFYQAVADYLRSPPAGELEGAPRRYRDAPPTAC